MLILPPEKKSKIGSKEPENRQNLGCARGLIALSILGVTGRMGQKTLSLAHKDPLFHVVSGVCRSPSVHSLGALIQDASLTAPLLSDVSAALQLCDVAIDFSLCAATRSHLEAACKWGTPLVIGTTGHCPEDLQAIQEASRLIPILFAPNFSRGAALCIEAVARFSQALFPEVAICIKETHHIHKKDAPSKTALALAAATGKEGGVQIESTRSGEVIGEHTVIFECKEERIEIKHTAHSRDLFAAGALLSAKFLVAQPPGLYSLKDML